MKKNVALKIDCAKLKTAAEIHAAIAKQLHFPDYYGANLDALRDCLGDVLIEHPIKLVWKESSTSREDSELQAIHALLTEVVG